MDVSKPLIVQRFTFRPEAQLAHAHLADVGIPSAIADDSAQGVLAGGYYLYVRESDLAEAMDVLGLADLDASGDPGLLDADWVEGQVGTGLIGTLARLPRWVLVALITWALLFGLGALGSIF